MVVDLSQTNPIPRHTDLEYLIADECTDRFTLYVLGVLLVGKNAVNYTHVKQVSAAMRLSVDRVRRLMARLRDDARTPSNVTSRCTTLLDWSDGRKGRAPSSPQSRRIRRERVPQSREIRRERVPQSREIRRDSTHPSYMLEHRALECSNAHEGENAPQGRESTNEQQVTNRGGQSNAPADIVSRVWTECGIDAVRPSYRAYVNDQLRDAPAEQIEVAARYFAADRTAVKKAHSCEAVFVHSWKKYVAAWQAGEKEGVRTMPYRASKPAPPVNDWQRPRDQGPTPIAPARRVAPVAPARRVAPVALARRVARLSEAWHRQAVDEIEAQGKIATDVPRHDPRFVPAKDDAEAIDDERIVYAMAVAAHCAALEIRIKIWDLHDSFKAAEEPEESHDG